MKHGLVTDGRDMGQCVVTGYTGQMEITGDTEIFITRALPLPPSTSAAADRDAEPVNLRAHIRAQDQDQKDPICNIFFADY